MCGALASINIHTVFSHSVWMSWPGVALSIRRAEENTVQVIGLIYNPLHRHKSHKLLGSGAGMNFRVATLSAVD